MANPIFQDNDGAGNIRRQLELVATNDTTVTVNVTYPDHPDYPAEVQTPTIAAWDAIKATATQIQ
jgi:hypothetical protein